MVAYFGRCLIIISKDKIASYHIWKMVLQSFLCELGGKWQRRGERERLQHEDTKRCREWNLRDHFEEKFQTYGQEVFLLFAWGKPSLCWDQTAHCQREWMRAVWIEKVVENFEQFLSRLIWHGLNINQSANFPSCLKAKNVRKDRRHLCHVSNTISSDRIWHLTLTRPKTLML